MFFVYSGNVWRSDSSRVGGTFLDNNGVNSLLTGLTVFSSLLSSSLSSMSSKDILLEPMTSDFSVLAVQQLCEIPFQAPWSSIQRLKYTETATSSVCAIYDTVFLKSQWDCDCRTISCFVDHVTDKKYHKPRHIHIKCWIKTTLGTRSYRLDQAYMDISCILFSQQLSTEESGQGS